MFHTICVILIFACFSISSFRIFAFFGFNLKSTCLQQQHYLYFSHQLKYCWMQILRNELIRYPFTFLCSWLRLQYNFVGTRSSSMLVDYLLPIKGASSSIYIPSLGCCGSSKFVSEEFHPAGDSPSCPAQWSEARLKFGISLEICDIKNAHKKVSGRAGLICNSVVAL